LDPSFVNELGLRMSGGKEVSGTGAGSIPTRSVGRVTADLKGARFTMSAPIVVDLSKVPIPNWTRGLVGAELFENYVVRIDPAQKTLMLYEPRTFHYSGGGSAIPFVLANHRLYFNATLTVRPGLSVTHRLRVDTGSGDSIDDAIVSQSRSTQKT